MSGVEHCATPNCYGVEQCFGVDMKWRVLTGESGVMERSIVMKEGVVIHWS